jgi:TRAP-type C4-dicarboxylate transport system permease large subunit
LKFLCAWRGVTPFIIADLARMTVLVLVPSLSLALPKALGL